MRTRNRKFINSLLPLCGFGILILIVSVVLNFIPDGADISSREAILRGMQSGQEWSICEESLLEDHILANVVSEEMDGLAVFRPVGDGYTCSAFETVEKGDVVRINTIINDGRYDCFWLNQEDLARLEVRYNNAAEPMKFLCENGGTFWASAPNEAYSIRVTYFDSQEKIAAEYQG